MASSGITLSGDYPLSQSAADTYRYADYGTLKINGDTYTMVNGRKQYDRIHVPVINGDGSTTNYTYTLHEQQEGKKEQKMNRALYEVTVVDPEMGIVTHEEQVVATTPENAKIKALKALPNADPDELDVFVRKIGDVRPKAEMAAA